MKKIRVLYEDKNYLFAQTEGGEVSIKTKATHKFLMEKRPVPKHLIKIIAKEFLQLKKDKFCAITSAICFFICTMLLAISALNTNW